MQRKIKEDFALCTADSRNVAVLHGFMAPESSVPVIKVKGCRQHANVECVFSLEDLTGFRI